MSKTPIQIANDFGLEFTTEQTQDGKWTRFKFTLPEVESPDFGAAITKVTQWRSKIQPWLFVGTADTVASELSFGNRVKVAYYNRKNRKAIVAFWSDEAVARRLALSQPTPEQGISVLKTVPGKEKATKQLREQLERAVTVLSRPEPVVPNLGDSLGGDAVH